MYLLALKIRTAAQETNRLMYGEVSNIEITRRHQVNRNFVLTVFLLLSIAASLKFVIYSYVWSLVVHFIAALFFFYTSWLLSKAEQRIR